ncbi:MAG: ankyrin repeat domain-containing protein [Alphaproteobacteria bacterium]|nr:ankyrin repeat domain-containing protein [Alphaproteobacteria bacterium]
MTQEATNKVKNFMELEKEVSINEQIKEEPAMPVDEEVKSQEKRKQISRLISLVEEGDLRHVQEFLLDKKIGVNVQDEKGLSPLMVAARNGRVRLTEYMIENQADLDLIDEKGKTALMMAISNGYNRTAQLLMETGAGLNIQTKNGLTALMKAVQKGDMDMVEGLVKRGADLDQQDCYGLTALMHAVQSGFNDLVLFLIVSGADMDKKDVTGKTATDWANAFSHVECMRLLLQIQEERAETKSQTQPSNEEEGFVAPQKICSSTPIIFVQKTLENEG